jgi:hypothetical protein
VRLTGDEYDWGYFVSLAGRFLAVQGKVHDLRRGRAHSADGEIDDLERDGRAAVTDYQIVGNPQDGDDHCATQRVGVASPRRWSVDWISPRFDCDAVPALDEIAGGRVAYGTLTPRRYDGTWPPGRQRHRIVLNDLHGHDRTLAIFPRDGRQVPIVSNHQAFDGRRLAYTVRRCDGSEDVWVDDVDRDPAFVDRAPLRCRVRATRATSHVDSRGRTRLHLVCPDGCLIQNRDNDYLGFPPSPRSVRVRYDLGARPRLLRRIRREGRVRARIAFWGADRGLDDVRLRRTFTFERGG